MRARLISTAFLLSAQLSACGEPCTSEMVRTQISPGGDRQAGFFRKNCGATSGYVYEVRVSEKGLPPSEGETVLRFDDNHGKNWPADDSGVVRLAWQDDTHLRVVVLERVRVFKEDIKAAGTEVVLELRKGGTRL